MSFLSNVRTRHACGWLSFFWFLSAVSIRVHESVELRTLSTVTVQCGENVTLTCDASTLQLHIIKFTFHGNNKTCDYRNPQSESDIVCETKSETDHQTLTMTLLNVMPPNQGKYYCKLHTTQGTYSSTTVVAVQDCLDAFENTINKTHAKCVFSGLYPNGIIHWHQNGVNLTASATTWEEEDQYGRHNVSSTIDVQKGNTSQPYVCSMWIPSVGKNLKSLELYVYTKHTSSGDVGKLQWSIIIVEMIMVIWLT
ncbi:cell adhesion molecule 1 [Antennarius striatus]|uniref:cell adhesion molecule 1 n=1 Tax=Antennarius striatus TaxID=241820 RepID=UPI0035AE4BA4